MLLEGCKKYNHTEIADIIDFYGADMNITATPDANIISFTVLRKYFNNIFELLCEILKDPLFNEDRLEYIKNKKIQELKIENTKNKTIAYKTFKEQYIKQVANEYKDKIPKKLYDAMYRYEVEITD